MIGTSRSIFLNAASAASPFHIAGHHHVEDDRRGTLAWVPLDCVCPVAQRDRLITTIGKERFEERAHGLIVVYDHDVWFIVEMHG